MSTLSDMVAEHGDAAYRHRETGTVVIVTPTQAVTQYGSTRSRALVEHGWELHGTMSFPEIMEDILAAPAGRNLFYKLVSDEMVASVRRQDGKLSLFGVNEKTMRGRFFRRGHP